MPLTDTAVKKAKPGSRPIKLSDGRGMYLLVNPTGSKLWRWKYRVLGKERLMSFGAYPGRFKADISSSSISFRGSDPPSTVLINRMSGSITFFLADNHAEGSCVPVRGAKF